MGRRERRHRDQRTAQVLRRERGRARHRPVGCLRRGLRVPRAQRRGEDDHGRDPRGVSRAERGRGQRPGHRPEGRRTALGASGSGSCSRSAASSRSSRVRETLELYAGYYSSPRGVDETIALVGLEGKADDRAGKLSGGQQRRLDVAMALIGDAELLFLDEPTTGFDPSARRQAWEVIASLRELGKTVFLTTHYMDEAQYPRRPRGDHPRRAESSPRGLRTSSAAEPRLLRGSRSHYRPMPSCRTLEGSVAMQGSYVEITTTSPTRTLHELTEMGNGRTRSSSTACPCHSLRSRTFTSS